VYASRYMPTQSKEATVHSALRRASRLAASPPQKSTIQNGWWERQYGRGGPSGEGRLTGVSVGCLRGGVAGPNNIAGVETAGHLGNGRIGKEPVSGQACLVLVYADGRQIVCAMVMRHTPCMTGDRIVVTRE
jgi:hypothetical protein